MTRKIKSILYLFSALLLIVMMQPYFVWGWPKKLLILLEFLMLGIFSLNCRIKSIREFFMFAFFASAIMIIPLHRGANILGTLQFVLLATIPFLNEKYFVGLFKSFISLYSIILTISFFVWILYLMGVPLPGRQIEPLNALKVTDIYFRYPFLIVIVKMNSLSEMIRFCSIFDEPGVVGTANLLLLYINGFDFKKFHNIMFFVTGVASFSLFFVIGVIVYYAIRMFKRGTTLKYMMMYMIGVFAFLALILFNPIAKEMVGYRLQFDKENNQLVGDNRASDDLKDHISKIRGTRAYWWGEKSMVATQFDGDAGYRNEILRYGAVYMLCFMIFFLFYALYYTKDNKHQILVFVVLLLMCLYQRPGVIDPVFLFLYSSAPRIPYINMKLNVL